MRGKGGGQTETFPSGTYPTRNATLPTVGFSPCLCSEKLAAIALCLTLHSTNDTSHI
jgi:hypothetical protein